MSLPTHLDRIGPRDVVAVTAPLLVVDDVEQRAALHELRQEVRVVGGDGHAHQLPRDQATSPKQDNTRQQKEIASKKGGGRNGKPHTDRGGGSNNWKEMGGQGKQHTPTPKRGRKTDRIDRQIATSQPDRHRQRGRDR